MGPNPPSILEPPSKLAESLSQKKIPSLDGLRAVAVSLVILNHLETPYIPQGRGVLTFFVLSGFLITWVMLKELEKYDGVSVRDFYVRRVLRIFPAFYLYLGLQFGSELLLRGWPQATVVRDYLSAFTYTSNFRHALMPRMTVGCAQTWALAIEEQFYLLWPWFFVAFQRDLRKLTSRLIAMIVVVDIYRLVLMLELHAPSYRLNFAFDTRVDHLLMGCLLAVLIKRGVLTRFWNFLTARTWLSLAPLSLIVLSCAMEFRYPYAYRFGIGFMVDPLLTAILIVQVVAMGNTWLWGWLNWRAVRYLGRISYGMFLYHLTAKSIVMEQLGLHSLRFAIPAVFLGTVMLGALSFHVVELRFLRLKSKFSGYPADRRVAVMAPSSQFAA